MDLPENRLPLLSLEDPVVKRTQSQLREERNKQHNADDLMRGIEMFRPIVLHRDHTPSCEGHAEEDESDALHDDVAFELVPDTEE